MTQQVYTIYWVNRRNEVRKQHGSFKTEAEAFEAIEAWWELHKEKYENVVKERTNSGALEITYDDENYVYRIESRKIEGKLPSRSYKLKSRGEIESTRRMVGLDNETLIFDELAEPYRDRLIVAMADSKRVRDFVYNEKGRPIVEINDFKMIQKNKA